MEEFYMIAFSQCPIHYPEITNDSPVGVEYRIEDKGLQWGVRVSRRSWDLMDDVVHYPVNAYSHFCAGFYDFIMITSQQVNDLVLHLFHHRIVHINLV